MKIHKYRYNVKLELHVVISMKSDDRVAGYIVYEHEPRMVDFNVKHDGKTFSVGSGSGKHTFYFKNIED